MIVFAVLRMYPLCIAQIFVDNYPESTTKAVSLPAPNAAKVGFLQKEMF